MGFGILFIGYILFLNPFNFYLLAPSACVMAFGLRKLSAYNNGFLWAYRLSFPLLLGGLLSLLLMILRQTSSHPSFLPAQETCESILAVAVYSVLLLFYLCLFSGIAEMAEETGLPKLRFAAVRNRIFSGIYCVACAVLQFEFGESFQRVISVSLLSVLLIGVVISVLNLHLFYSCYMYICLPGDAAPEQVPSQEELLSRLKRKNERQKDREEKKNGKK